MNTGNPKSSTFLNVVLISILFAAFFIIYFPVWKGLVLLWYQAEEYSHGFFIIPICIYIIWQKKERLSEIPIKSSWLGIVLVIISLLLYFFAYVAEINTVASFSIIPLLMGVILYLYGYLMLRELMFPLFFLLFMIPVPSQIYSSLTIPLQLFVSKVSVSFALFFGIPIYREGNVIHLPEQTLQVVQACSGLRSMISLLTLSAIFGYFTLKSNILRSALFVSGIPVAVLVNIIRVLLMIVAFYYFKLDLTGDNIHTVFGMMVFALALIIIALVRGVFSIWDIKVLEK